MADFAVAIKDGTIVEGTGAPRYPAPRSSATPGKVNPAIE